MADGGNDTYIDGQVVFSDAPAASAPVEKEEKAPIVMGYTSQGLPLLSSNGSAADNLAAITRALWTDYKDNYAPFQQMMLNQMTTENPGIVAEEVDAAKRQVGMSYNTAAKNQQTTMSRLGMAPDAQTQQNLDRNNALSKATALAAAANTTRQGLKERDMLIMTGGVPNVAGRAYGMSGD